MGEHGMMGWGSKEGHGGEWVVGTPPNHFGYEKTNALCCYAL